MVKSLLSLIQFLLLVLFAGNVFCQTSWTGLANTNWNAAGNWTAGVPNTGTDAIIGDASFIGSNQPTVNASSSCKSVVIGGAVAVLLTLKKNLVVNGAFTINANGTVTHPNSTLTVKGNWSNSGGYNTTNNNAKLVFAGTSQTILGANVTSFNKVTINTGTTINLAKNMVVDGVGSYLYVYGTIDPGQSPAYTLTSTANFRLYNNATLKVNASYFDGNYILSGSTTFYAGNIINYSSTVTNQYVSNEIDYSTLVISGTGIKTLIGNLPLLNSSTSTKGNLIVSSATLDLKGFTANRGTSKTGGEINIGNGAFLKLSGASNFPTNYNTRTFALASTVEYNGTAQNISAQTYGNLLFTSGSGASVKTFPATALTVDGNFTIEPGAGTSVNATAGANFTVNGDVTLSAATTLNGGSYSHTLRGNWVNNGIFNGNTSIVSFDGPSKSITGNGLQNFYDLNILRSGITGSGIINVNGNFATSGPGEFTHASGGSFAMTGTSKSISGANIIFSDLSVPGTVTSTASVTIAGNMLATGSFVASSGVIIMNGSSKSITGPGTLSFSTLQLEGTITTAAAFTVSSLLNVTGSFTATAGTASFTGVSSLSGTANLYNVTINGTSFQLTALCNLGISNVFTISAGTFNTSSTTPNTVSFNSSGNQNVNGTSYNNLVLMNGATKTALGNVTVGGNITIATATSFAAGVFTHTILKNWINNGTFTAGVGNVQFTGVANATIAGNNTFNTLTINKSTVSNTVTLLNNVSTTNAAITNGMMLTGANKITITSDRSGNGIIMGTITRTHVFLSATSYAFEGPVNTLNFSTIGSVSSVTVTVTAASIGDFPNAASINRQYNIAVTGAGYTATLRLHYEDAELNGNSEATMGFWNYTTAWTLVGKSGNNTATNYVEQSGITNLNYRWTCSEIPGVVQWNGSVSSNWNTAANWTVISGGASAPPAANDIVQIGTSNFTNQPAISTAVSVKGISFGSVKAATLTLAAGGSLATTGNISGTWSADAVHAINAATQNITVNGSLVLSNAVTNRSINLSIGTGTVTVAGSVIQKGNASIIFTGIGNLKISGDYDYTSGTVTAGAGTITYQGSLQQAIATVPYNNLTVSKTSSIASLNAGVTLTGNLVVTSGTVDANNSIITIGGNCSISSGAVLDCDAVQLFVGGNWTNSGTYIFSSGTVTFNGSGTQSISAGTFNNVVINKPSGSVLLTGNNTLAGNLSILGGTLNLATYVINRQTLGGIFTLANGTILQLQGSSNFPVNFSINTLHANSTVLYDGTITQVVAAASYGHLTFSNGGSNAKTQVANISVSGNLILNSGATFSSGGYSTSLEGNWTNSGTFTSLTGVLILNGTNKTLTGNTTFYRVTVNGSYVVAGSNMNYNNTLLVNAGASYDAGGGIANLSGDLINSGTLISNGTTNFTGTTLQTIRLLNALVSTSTGVVNFNGNISPVLNSTSTPQFATLNINNTQGVNPSVDWTVGVSMSIATGAKFNGGIATHTIYGAFTNAGTVTSSGEIDFLPFTAKTVALGSGGFTSDGVVNFGGSGQLTITGTPGALNTVIISNSNPSGVTAPSNWLIDSNFVVKNTATFNAGGNTYTVGGNIESDGILNGGTSTFIVTGADAELSVSTETAFNNLTITGRLTPQTDFRVGGSFTNNGSYDGSIGVLIMSGSSAGTIAGTTNPSSIAQITIEKTSNAIVTQNVPISDVGFINIFSGTLFTSTHIITQDAGGGFLIINSDATLRIGGTNSLPAFIGYGLDENSTVDYAGTTQLVGNAADYGHLIISATGNKNAYTSLRILGNLSVSAGNLNTATVSVSHYIAGNITMTGGTISGTNSTYVLDGAADQNLTMLSNFVRLRVNKASGYVNLLSDITANLSLTFTQGKIKTNAFKVIIPSAGAVLTAGQSTGWVYGNLQKNIATGAAVSRTFEVGGDNYYSPASVLFASVASSGNLIGAAQMNDHSQMSWSLVDVDLSVNRYWKFVNTGTVFTTADITFNWVASDLDAGVNTSAFGVGGYDGAAWALPAVTAANPTSIKATGLTSFKEYGIGEGLTQFKWTGAALTDNWYTQTNWKGGVPNLTLSTVIPNSLNTGRIYPEVNTGTCSVKNITIESLASLKITGGTLQVAGIITNNGVLDVKLGTVQFIGTTLQTIADGTFTANRVKNLIISNNVNLTGVDTLLGTLTMDAGKTFTTNDKLILKSDSAGTARIASLPVDAGGNATAYINGKVTVERFIPLRKAWRLLSAPVKSINAPSINTAWQEGLTSASPDPDLFPGYGVMIQGGSTASGFDQGLTSSPSVKVFNNASNNFVGLPAALGTNAAISSYPGYFVYIRGDRSINLMQGNAAAITKTTLRIKGEVNTGKQIVKVDSLGYTVFGNPYASAIDFASLTRNNVKNSFYVWDPKLAGQYGLGGYVAFSWNSSTGLYDATSSASPLSQYIPSGEAILVQSGDSINPGTITVNESAKTSNGSDQVFGRTNGFNQRIRVNLYAVNTGGTTALLDGVLTTYDNDNNNDVDADDAAKLNGSGENIGIRRNGRVLAIERRKTVTEADTTFLNISHVKVQQYQLEIIVNNLSATNNIAVLKDSYNNSINNMPLNMDGVTMVPFDITTNPASYAANRFSIVFEKNQVLPVSITSVTAVKQKSDVLVEWKTANEINIDHYEIERSEDGLQFLTIGSKPSSATTGTNIYNFTDLVPAAGIHFYRIRSVSAGGVYSISKIVNVSIHSTQAQPGIKVFPNPVTSNTINVEIKQVEKGDYTLTLIDAKGRLIQTKMINYSGTDTNLKLLISNQFAHGRYELVMTGNGIKISSPVIKQ